MKEVNRAAGADSAAFCVAAVLGSLGFWLVIQRASYAALLSPTLARGDDEAWLIPAMACAESLLLLLPGVLLASVLGYRRGGRSGAWALIAWASVAFAAEALDLQIYGAFGRHLSEIGRFAVTAGGAQVAGGAGRWALVVTGVLLESTLLCTVGVLAVRSVIVPLALRASRDFRRLIAALALPTLAACAALPWFGGTFFQHADLRERLYKQLVWPPPSQELANAGSKDPNWVALDAGLRAAYARAFPKLFAQQRLTINPGVERARPNVVILLLESWRADSLTPERMPRLSAWAEHGLVAEQHYGGSNYSEAGMFSLLFGRSPLLFHAALDAHEPAGWCPMAHQMGMECSYFSGHPKLWMRREEFLNPAAVDHFVHDDHGDWTEWDRNALSNAVAALLAPGARPQIALVYLMSTHFEYEYPSAYERHHPVRNDMSWRATDLRALGAADQLPITNRYLNSLAFMDDVVADAIAKLDPTQNVIVLTGDHGESLGEDGHFGHGYGFADSIARVPFAMVGPGISPSHRAEPSLHADLLRSLVHALGGQASGPAEAQDLLATSVPRSGLLLAHCSYGHQVADAQLSHGSTHLRLELGLRSAEVNLLWPEDRLGHPVPTSTLDAKQVRQLIATFETELRAIYSPERSL